MKNLIAVIIIILFTFSCGGGQQKENKIIENEFGTKIEYFKEGVETPVDTLVSIYQAKYTTEKGQVLLETTEENPLPIKLSEKPPQKVQLYEIFSSMKIGDSIGFTIPTNEFFKDQPIPDSIDKEGSIQFNVTLTKQYTEEGFFAIMKELSNREMEKQKNQDSQILKDYFVANNIDPQEHESGIFYVVSREGTGSKPDSGQMVQVNYSGRVLEGPYFDTSIEEVAKQQGIHDPKRPYQPFQFPIKAGQVIGGWDIGLSLFNVGTKATLYIPSPLGYGRRGAGQVIKPNDILVFDVEILGIQ